MHRLIQFLEILQNKGGKWIVLIRAHVVSAGIKIDTENGKIIDVTKYPDMAELLPITDMLITDYSSCAGDFILTGKATILATFDLKEYGYYCRELQYDLKDAGFIVAENQFELERIVKLYSAEDYKKNCDHLCKHFGIVETGHSASDICGLVNEKYLEYMHLFTSQRTKKDKKTRE